MRFVVAGWLTKQIAAALGTSDLTRLREAPSHPRYVFPHVFLRGEAGTGEKLVARAGAHDCLLTPVDYFRQRPPAPRSSLTSHHACFVPITF
jgi:hypothetical protein